MKATKRHSDEATKGNMKRSSSPSSLRRFVAPSLAPRAFTLTEVLIVIAIIVLMLALALPAFNFITGGKSVDAAYNTIGAMLARARTEAVGLQEIRGVMFYIDPKTQRQTMALVQATPAKTTDDANVDVYLGMGTDADHLVLPKGVGIQVVNDGSLDPNQLDRYFGFNAGPGPVLIGGVILFDGFGRLTSQHYGFRMTDATTASGAPSQMAKFLLNELSDPSPPPAADFFQPLKTVAGGIPVPGSAVGFVLFDNEIPLNKFGTTYTDDSNFTNSVTTGSEQAEEKWFDDNATPVLINRYNGTLVKGD
jgi:prepilin-type N-terminal cleavage/methylation domain-containing protein